MNHTSWEEAFYGGPYAGKSIEHRDRGVSSLLHSAMKAQGMAHFRAARFRVFPRQIGLWGHEQIWRFADFAIEKARRVRLVECLTPWNTTPEMIAKKLQLERFALVDFVGAKSALPVFKSCGFRRAESIGSFEEHEIVYVKKG